MADAFIYAGLRTPFGRYAGALAGSRPDDLAAAVVRGVVDHAPNLDPADVDDVILGCANGAGEDNRNVGRMAVLLAGLPVSVPGVTVNRLCGSSMQAAMDGSRLIEAGDASVVVAGGVESMTRAPWVLPKPARGSRPVTRRCLEHLGLAARQPADARGVTASLGERDEQLADELGIGRDRQDAFAVLSHQRAAQAGPTASTTTWCCRSTDSTATRASDPTPTSRPSPYSSRRSGPTAPSPPATTPHLSTTARVSTLCVGSDALVAVESVDRQHQVVVEAVGPSLCSALVGQYGERVLPVAADAELIGELLVALPERGGELLGIRGLTSRQRGVVETEHVLVTGREPPRRLRQQAPGARVIDSTPPAAPRMSVRRPRIVVTRPWPPACCSRRAGSR